MPTEQYESTVLVLTGIGVPPYSARGLRQTLEPIGQSVQLERTVNGDLIDISEPQFRKFNSTITGNDQQPPACDGVWPGHQVTVHCLVEWAVEGELTEDDTEGFDRPPVPGSIRYANGFTFYRPILVMRVSGFSVDRDEWAAGVDWSMSLEEI